MCTRCSPGPADETTIRLPDLSTARFTGSSGLSRSTVSPSFSSTRRCAGCGGPRNRACLPHPPPPLKSRRSRPPAFSRLFPRQHSGRITLLRLLWISRNIQCCELAFTHLEMVRHILDRVLVRELAQAQECAAAIRVANAIPALRVHMHVAEVNIRRSINAHSRRERRARTSYAITVIVRNREIAAVINFQRKRFRALARLPPRSAAR